MIIGIYDPNASRERLRPQPFTLEGDDGAPPVASYEPHVDPFAPLAGAWRKDPLAPTPDPLADLAGIDPAVVLEVMRSEVAAGIVRESGERNAARLKALRGLCGVA